MYIFSMPKSDGKSNGRATWKEEDI